MDAEQTWVGLLSPVEGTCGALAGGEASAPGTNAEHVQLQALLQEFDDVF